MRLLKPAFVAVAVALAAVGAVPAGPAVGANPEAGPLVTVADVSISEGTGTNPVATFTLSIGPNPGVNKKVTVATSNGTAVAVKDYAAVAPTVLTFNAITGLATVSVTILGDSSLEPNEQFALNLSVPVGVSIGRAVAVGTIVDDEKRTITVSNASVFEGNSGTTNLSFVVALNKVAAVTSALTVSTSQGTASSPSDFTGLVAAPVNLPVGATSATVNVVVKGDVLLEPTENLTLTLNPQSTYLVGDGSGLGTIVNDDGLSTVSIGATTVTELNSGQALAQFPLTLSPAPQVVSSIKVSTANGSAQAGSDYVAATNQVFTVPAGLTTVNVPIAIIGDTALEDTETFTVTIVDLGGHTAGASLTATGTIIDNDAVPVVSVSDAAVTEGNSGQVGATFTISLDRPTAVTRTVSFRTNDGTAVAASGDYAAKNGSSVTIPAGSQTATFQVIVNGDTEAEADETFGVQLTSFAGLTGGDVTGTGTITNDDNGPTVSISDVTVTEGSGGGTTVATVTVSFSQPTVGTELYRLRTSNGTAVTPGDYLAINVATGVPPGVTSRTFNITIVRDSIIENNETVTLTLSELSGLRSGDLTATITIIDDDQIVPTANISDGSVTEGNSGVRLLEFTVSLSPTPTTPVSVRVVTFDGTATAPGDYQALDQILNFAAGQSSAVVSVNVHGDTIVEPNETLMAGLTDPVGMAILDGGGLGTITNDDAAAGLRITSISNPSITEGNSGTKNLNFLLTFSGTTTGSETFTISTANGTATGGSDYVTRTNSVIAIAAGLTQRNVTITINGDTTAEPDETLLLNIVSATGLTIEDNQATGTITNDDGGGGGGLRITSISNPSISEGNSGTKNLNFLLTFSGTTTGTETITISTANGTATGGSDYVTRTNSVIAIAAGLTQRNVTITINGDTTVEANETLLLNILSAVGLTLDDNQATGTITNDD